MALKTPSPWSKSSNNPFNSDFKSSFSPFGGGNEEVTNLKKKLEEIKLPEETRKIVD